jgi:hypothetical protein
MQINAHLRTSSRIIGALFGKKEGKMRIILLGILINLVSCSNTRQSSSAESRDVPMEVYSEFRNRLFFAEQLAKYDKLAWVATDSVQKYIRTLPPEKIKGYVVEEFQDSTVVSFGAKSDSGRYIKYCQAVFEPNGLRSVLFNGGRIGNANETKMFYAIRKSVDAIGEEERARGRHNYYALMAGDTVKVYLIPGYIPGKFIFGGSFLFTYVQGQSPKKKDFNVGYQYFKEQGKPIDVELYSEFDEIANECDIMKFLAYRGYIRKMKINTPKYIFLLTHKEKGETGFDILKNDGSVIVHLRTAH